MKYIYDILLNFQTVPYEFYEWNNNDYISHIRKIPAFKISEDVMKDVLNFNVVFDNLLLKKIINKCEIFTKKGIKKIKYAFIVCDSNTSLALILDNNGKTIKISKLLIDEDIEVCEFSTCLNVIDLKYKVLDKRKIFNFKSRHELELENKIINNLEIIKKDSDITQMQYLHYECFNKKSNNLNYMFDNFINEIKKNNKNVTYKLDSIFNMLSIKYL